MDTFRTLSMLPLILISEEPQNNRATQTSNIFSGHAYDIFVPWSIMNVINIPNTVDLAEMKTRNGSGLPRSGGSGPEGLGRSGGSGGAGLNEIEPDASAPDILAHLAAAFDALTPQPQRAARYVLDNPAAIGVSSIREIADAAGVKPNTVVRMARALGFEGYDDFRAPFRDYMRAQNLDFPSRARWLQSLSKGDGLDHLFSQMAQTAIGNIEESFKGLSAELFKEAADCIVEARRAYILGVGVNNSLARNFVYLAGMALDSVLAVPISGETPVDALARAGPNDVVLAMTFAPYRCEVIEAVDVAKAQGARIIGISDSHGSPLITRADFKFVVAAETPQFFPSSVATVALLETLISFVIADASQDVIAEIEAVHRRRHALGLYLQDYEDGQ